jgi:hypothetical protein
MPTICITKLNGKCEIRDSGFKKNHLSSVISVAKLCSTVRRGIDS